MKGAETHKFVESALPQQRIPKQYLIFSDSGKAVGLQNLLKNVGKVVVKEDDGLLNQICRNCYR